MASDSILFTDTLNGGLIASAELANSTFEINLLELKIEISFPNLIPPTKPSLPANVVAPKKFESLDINLAGKSWGEVASLNSDLSPREMHVKRVGLQVFSDLDYESIINILVSSWEEIWTRFQVWIEIFTEQNLETGTTYLNRGTTFLFSRIRNDHILDNHLVAKIFKGPIYIYKPLTKELFEKTIKKVSSGEKPSVIEKLLHQAVSHQIALDSKLSALNAFIALEIALTARIKEYQIDPELRSELSTPGREFDIDKSTLGTKIDIYQRLDSKPIENLNTDVAGLRNKLFHEGITIPVAFHEQIIDWVKALTRRT